MSSKGDVPWKAGGAAAGEGRAGQGMHAHAPLPWALCHEPACLLQLRHPAAATSSPAQDAFRLTLFTEEMVGNHIVSERTGTGCKQGLGVAGGEGGRLECRQAGEGREAVSLTGQEQAHLG